MATATIIILSTIVLSVSGYLFYRIYDHSRTEQANITKLLVKVDAEIQELEQKKDALEEDKGGLEQKLNSSFEALIEKAVREITDNNHSRLPPIVQEIELNHLIDLALLSDLLLQRYRHKGFNNLHESELMDAQRLSLMRITTSDSNTQDAVGEFYQLNNLCRVRGLPGIYVPVGEGE